MGIKKNVLWENFCGYGYTVVLYSRHLAIDGLNNVMRIPYIYMHMLPYWFYFFLCCWRLNSFRVCDGTCSRVDKSHLVVVLVVHIIRRLVPGAAPWQSYMFVTLLYSSLDLYNMFLLFFYSLGLIRDLYFCFNAAIIVIPPHDTAVII
jgi:hypothetical protein